MKSNNSASLNEIALQTGSMGLLLFSVAALLGGALLTTLLALLCRGTKSYAKGSHQVKMENTWVLWRLSHILNATCMLSTLAITSLWGTFVLVALCGLSWAVTIWAPYAIIGTTIAANKPVVQASTLPSHSLARNSGLVLALHHVAIASSQIAGVMVTTAVFWMVDEPQGLGNVIGWTLRVAAISTGAAAVLASGVDDMAHIEASG